MKNLMINTRESQKGIRTIRKERTEQYGEKKQVPPGVETLKGV